MPRRHERWAAQGGRVEVGRWSTSGRTADQRVEVRPESVVDGGVLEHDATESERGDNFGKEWDGNVRVELVAVLGGPEHGANPGLPVVGHGDQVGLQRRVGAGRCDEFGEDGGVAGVGGTGNYNLAESIEVSGEGAGVEGGERAAESLVSGDEEFVLGSPPRVHGGLGDPGTLRDPVHGQPSPARGRKFVEDGVDDAWQDGRVRLRAASLSVGHEGASILSITGEGGDRQQLTEKAVPNAALTHLNHTVSFIMM